MFRKRAGKIVWLGAALLLAAIQMGPGVAAAPANNAPRAIVYTSHEAVNEAARAGVEAHGGQVLKPLSNGGGLVVVLPEVAWERVADILGVVAVEPDLLLSIQKGPPPGKGPKDPTPTPTPEPSQNTPWGVDRVDADLAWAAYTGAGVDVAVIDTGIDSDHPDLAANIAGGVNFVGQGPPWKRRVDPGDWDDPNGHGTHVAGTIAAVNNAIGVVGVAPGARLWAVRVLDRNGSGYLSDVMDGIYWAADNNMEVINMSLGIGKETLDLYPNDRAALEAAVDYAYAANVVMVAAAGNEGPGTDTVGYPARFASVIAVSATDTSDGLAGFSSTGPSVELAAPGVGIPSTWPGGGYNTISGTSMASPHAAGAAALVVSSGVVANADVREALQTTADDLGPAGRDDSYGYGLVDAQEAATGVEGLP